MMMTARKDEKDIMTYDLNKKVIGIGSGLCFVCGKPKSNRHHVIPKSVKPLKNVTIPLCDEHKNVTHHVVRQYYFPKELRNKLSKAKKHSEDVTSILESVKNKLKFHNHKSPITKSK